MHNKKGNKYEDPYVEPYMITQVMTNKNAIIRHGSVQEIINFICITPIADNHKINMCQ